MTDFIYRKIQSVPRKYHSATCCSYYLNYCFSIHAVVAVVTIPHVSVTIVCLQNQITHINSHPDRCSSVPKQFCCIKINRYNLSNEKINIDIILYFVSCWRWVSVLVRRIHYTKDVFCFGSENKNQDMELEYNLKKAIVS